MKTWVAVVSLVVEADTEDEAIREACRLDDTATVESIVCIDEFTLEVSNENDETDP